MTELAQYCHEADFNASTGTCAAPYYGPVSGAFPTLSIADAQQIAIAIAVLWAAAWGIRRMVKLLDQLG